MKVLLAVDGSPHSHIGVAEVAERLWPDRTIVEVLSVIHAAAPMVLDPAFAMAAAHVERIEGEQRGLAATIRVCAASPILC
jgi:hypothetical protein